MPKMTYDSVNNVYHWMKQQGKSHSEIQVMLHLAFVKHGIRHKAYVSPSEARSKNRFDINTFGAGNARSFNQSKTLL